MNVAFDIDGVLTDVEKFQLDYGEKFFKANYNIEIKNKNGYSIKEIFDCTKEQEYLFWRKYILYYSKKYPARVGCGEMIKKIVSDGNRCYIISSRIKAADHDLIGFIMRIIVRKFLTSYNISYDNLIFCSTENSSDEKVKACLKNKIDVIVEDCPENINKLKEVTNVICFNASYNQDIYDNVVRVNNFYEIFEYINKLNNETKFKFLKRKERDQLTISDLKLYYQNLREYYVAMTDDKTIKKNENTYKLLYPALKKCFDAKYPYTVQNREKIPNKNGLIYVANHRDMIDPPLVMSLIGNKPTHLLLKAEFLESIFSTFLKSIGCVFVKRENKDSQILSKENLIEIVLNGGNIVIFPEGTRNKTEEDLLDFKLGAVSIAQVTGAPIVPIAIVKQFNDYRENIIIKVGDMINVEINDDIVEKNEMVKQSIKSMINNKEVKKLIKK